MIMKKLVQLFFILAAFIGTSLYLTKPFLRKLDDYTRIQREPLPSILERDSQESNGNNANLDVVSLVKKIILQTKAKINAQKITKKGTLKPTTEQTTKKPTKPTTKHKTEPTTKRITTKPTTKQTTKKITTQPTTKPTTQPTRQPTTEPTIEPTTKQTTKLVTKANTKIVEIKDTEWTFAPKKIREYKGDGSCGPHEDLKLNQQIFQWWVDLAAKHNVTYFLTCGTLLGAWRDGNIIPWDHDMDVLVAATDRIKLDPIRNMRPFHYDNTFRLILQEDWRLPYSKRKRLTCDGKEVPSYSGLCAFQEPFGRVIKRTNYIDIYDYTVADGVITDLSDYKKLYKVKDVFPLKKCKFMGIETFCPRDPYAVLKAIYGDHLVPGKECKQKKWY